MSSYVRSVPFKTEFDGEPVSCNIKPLSFGDALVLRSAVQKDSNEYLVAAATLLANYITDFVGPKDSDGTPVPLAEVLSVAYFAPLTVELATTLAGSASLKNSKASGEASTTSSPEAPAATTSGS